MKCNRMHEFKRRISPKYMAYAFSFTNMSKRPYARIFWDPKPEGFLSE